MRAAQRLLPQQQHAVRVAARAHKFYSPTAAATVFRLGAASFIVLPQHAALLVSAYLPLMSDQRLTL